MMTTRNDTCDWQALHSENSRMLNQQASKNKISKLLFLHASNALKAYCKKCLFFAQDCGFIYIQKVGYCPKLFSILLMYWFANFVCREQKFVTLWESRDSWPWHKSADTELEIFVAFFSDALASSRAARLCAATVTFLSLFSLDFVKMCFKTIFDDLVCGFISF